MARDVLYQSPGNPLQLSRLTGHRPDMAMRYLPYSSSQDTRLALELMRMIGALCIAALTVRVLVVIPLGTFDFFWANAIPAIAGLYLLLLTYREQNTTWLRVPMGCLAITTVYLNLPIPMSIHLLIVAAMLGLFTWMIADHWTSFCIASPLDRATASSLRQQWKVYFSGLSIVPAGITLLGFHSLSLALILASVVAAFQTFEVLRSGVFPKSVTAGWRAMVSWLTYDRHDVSPPGTMRSPVGNWFTRLGITAVCVAVCAVLPVDYFLSEALASATRNNSNVLGELRHLLATRLLLIPLIFVATAAITFVVPALLTMPLMAEAERYRTSRVDSRNWQTLIDEMRQSDDVIERESVFMGRISQDATPLLVPRAVFSEHAHFLGDSGGGKTSLGLCPLMEQLGSNGNCSIIVLDLKADSMELYGTLAAAAKANRDRTGVKIPVKHFTNQHDRSSFVFNLLRFPYWKELDLYMRTDILCGALGLTYGSDYGEGYYSSANAAVLYHTLKRYPDVDTYRELGERVGYVAAKAKDADLPPEIKKAGVHVKAVLDRLGACPALNAEADRGCTKDALRHAIDFTQVFDRPEFHYFHLSSTLSPGASPEIARLATYSLLAAATQVQRKHQVYLVIDEFQRMVSRNIEYMLQLARSMGVGVVLANQSMQDLRTSTADLIPAIEANCRYRQWFSVSAAEDRKRLIESSGETVDELTTRTINNSGPDVVSSVSHSEYISHRLTVNDVLLASDHERRSIVRISRGSGYAQYGGMPVIVESDYHITEREYERRKSTAWPDNAVGSFEPTKPDPNAQPTAKPSGPIVTTEVIGSSIDPLSQFKPQQSRRQKSEKS